MIDSEIWVEAMKCAGKMDAAYLAVSRPDGGFQYAAINPRHPEALRELVALAVTLYEVMRDKEDPFGALERALDQPRN